MLLYQAGLPLSSSTLRYLTGVIRAYRRAAGVWWRILDCRDQALMTLVYLRKGETYADLAAGFAVSPATVYRRVNETIDLLAARAAPLSRTLKRAKDAGDGFVIVDGTLIGTNRPAADRPYYSGKHRRHGMNIQAITSPHGDLLWTSGALPGAVHDTAAARIWQIPAHLRATGINALVDKGYCGLYTQAVAVPWKGHGKPDPKKIYNRLHARLRAPGERAFAQLKTWHILRKLRCNPHRTTNITRAITVLIHTG
ncbi:DDE superfamily endonuclease [Stackebrandtia endophytica]|uniref:DDE superfamily endonuclease n=1 Tax=Stackebrandtia endophytica TaxID=1496996 RepID=A0A543ARZ9_9ACTN|nr:transposase family protein [Stackebrandtia endophytica]TQL75354.1 DDE superfamily endonuclease [Stackebrandtia endophytica]